MLSDVLIVIAIIVAFSIAITIMYNTWNKIFPSKKKSTEEMMKEDGVFSDFDWKDHKREEHSWSEDIRYGSEPLSSEKKTYNHIERLLDRDNTRITIEKEGKAYEKILNYLIDKKYQWSDLMHYLENSEIESQAMWNRIERDLAKNQHDILFPEMDKPDNITKCSVDFLEDYGLKLDKENTNSICETPKFHDYKFDLVAQNVHPGEIIKFLISDFGMSDTLKKMSLDMKFNRTYLTKVIHGSDISIESSIKLDKYFNQPPNFFINVQTNFTRANAKS